MFSLGTSEFIRNIKRNLLVILQMTIVYCLAIFAVSSYVEQLRLFDGIKGFFDETGVIIQHVSDNYGAVEGLARPTEESLRKDLIKVDNIVTYYRYQMGLGDKKEENDFYIVAYDLDLIEFRPKLLEGKWCDDYEHTDGVINIVISDSFLYDLDVGETFEHFGITYRVTGIYDDSELTIAYDEQLPLKSNVGSYYNYYQSIREMNENEILSNLKVTYIVYGSYEDLVNEEIEPLNNTMITIDYEDDISEEEVETNRNVLMEKYGYRFNRDATDTEPIYDYSIRLLSIKIIPMLVIFIVIFLVSATCLINAGALNVLREKKNYGVYFICGNNWKNTLCLSLINWLCISATSILLAISICFIMKTHKAFENIALSFSLEHVIVIIAISIIMLMLALALPYSMLKKLQPVSILKDNDK